MRNVLLLEPNYKNKYPPIGLMKLATYHKRLGDNVVFYKGDLKEIVIQQITNLCISKLKDIDNTIIWELHEKNIRNFIKTRKKEFLEQIDLDNSKYEFLILNCLEEYKNYYSRRVYEKEPFWDRICITTLFTFYWDISIDTINFAKKLVKDPKELWVGGVLATVMPIEVEKATGVKPWKGLLNKKGILDNNEIIVDDLPLDYSILDEIEYIYPETNAFYGYTTRGCVRKCEFCAVPILEPKFCGYLSLVDRIEETRQLFGDKRNLLLLDNNILASKKFPKIIDEIKESGFVKGATFIEPNQLDIAIRNLKNGINDNAYKRKLFLLLSDFLKKLKGQNQQDLYNLLDKYRLLKWETVIKENLLQITPSIAELYEKYRNKSPKLRYVDYNQGIDARLLKEDKIKLLSEIPINPLRIAFDSMEYRSQYESAIRFGAKYGITRFSNYLLYNYDELPTDLYNRLKINVDLCDELDISIYSFPMKYHPIIGDEKYNREFIGTHWNRKFIRSVQAILNATKGKIGRGKSFFNKAFGANEEEFYKLLFMPETYIIYRFFFEGEGYTERWWQDFNNLNNGDLVKAKQIIELNEFKDTTSSTKSKKIQKVLSHYLIGREDLTDVNSELSKLKKKFDAEFIFHEQ